MDNRTFRVVPFLKPEQSLRNAVFVFIDLQQEYATSGRAYALKKTLKCLDNCQRLLAATRAHGLNIAHFRQLKSGTFFNRETEFSNWITEFRPRPNEMIFEREQPSVYTNSAFESFIDQITWPELIVCGLTGEMGCLSTAIDSAHREHRLTFVSDASASRSMGKYSEEKSHEVVTAIIKMYAKLASTEEILSRIYGNTTAKRGQDCVVPDFNY